MIDRGWVRRAAGRVLTFTCEGVEGFEAAFKPEPHMGSQAA
jgi:hypothetical protein